MEVPEHIYYGNNKRRQSRSDRNSNSFHDMFVPDKITVGAGNVLIPHLGQPNDVLRDKPVPLTDDPISPIPSKLTANEFPSEDLAKMSKKQANNTKANSKESLLQSVESLNGLNASLAIESDPIRELKNVRRQMGRLATRVLELEDENNRRVTREYGLLAAFTGSLAILAFLIFKK